jgi:hypothetical protein
LGLSFSLVSSLSLSKSSSLWLSSVTVCTCSSSFCNRLIWK